MSWNHRIVKTRDEVMGEDIYSVHEAYYIGAKGKKIKTPLLTVEPIRVSGSSIKDLEWLFDVLKKALKTPIINRVKRTKKQKIEDEREYMRSCLASAGGSALRLLELDPKDKEAGFVEYMGRIQIPLVQDKD